MTQQRVGTVLKSDRPGFESCLYLCEILGMLVCSSMTHFLDCSGLKCRVHEQENLVQCLTPSQWLHIQVHSFICRGGCQHAHILLPLSRDYLVTPTHTENLNFLFHFAPLCPLLTAVVFITVVLTVLYLLLNVGMVSYSIVSVAQQIFSKY